MNETSIYTQQRRRLDRLLQQMVCVRDCSQAIPFIYNKHIELFDHDTIQPRLSDTLNRQREWSDGFRSAEQQLMAALPFTSETDCPDISRKSCPNPFEVTDTLYRIGYYRDDAQHIYWQEVIKTREMVIQMISQLESFVFMAMKALACAVYRGKWQAWGEQLSVLFSTMPQNVGKEIEMIVKDERKL